MNTLFDLDTLPVKQQAAAAIHYHLYFDRDGVRRYLYPKKACHPTRRWQWLTIEEAGERRKRKTYHDSASAVRSQRHWQQDVKDGVVIRIEAYEVHP
jgi:hypothetical protein